MQYLLVHTLSSPAKEWVDGTKNHIIQEFKTMDIRGIPPHITLKYYFEEKDLEKIQIICATFIQHHRAVPFNLFKYDSFGKEVIFLKVLPSEKMNLLYRDIFNAVDADKIPFDKNEINGIHFHVTLATGAQEQYDKIMNYLHEDEPSFSLMFDNLTILSYDGQKFSVYKTYEF